MVIVGPRPSSWMHHYFLGRSSLVHQIMVASNELMAFGVDGFREGEGQDIR